MSAQTDADFAALLNALTKADTDRKADAATQAAALTTAQQAATAAQASDAASKALLVKLGATYGFDPNTGAPLGPPPVTPPPPVKHILNPTWSTDANGGRWDGTLDFAASNFGRRGPGASLWTGARDPKVLAWDITWINQQVDGGKTVVVWFQPDDGTAEVNVTLTVPAVAATPGTAKATGTVGVDARVTPG